MTNFNQINSPLLDISRQTILITGGTSSFGNAICRLLQKTDVKEIRIFSRDEKKQDNMRWSYRDKRNSFFIDDVHNNQSNQDAMTGVDLVFYTAALKQVPSCEFYLMEALITNSIEVENVPIATIPNRVRQW